jgi:hypothetical protein
MNLTAHPLSVAAELAWKREALGGAGLAPHHDRERRRPSTPHVRAWLRRRPHFTHRPRPV